MNWLRANPQWAMGMGIMLVEAIINGAILFGWNLTLEQAAWINGITAIVLSIVLSIWAGKPIQALVDNAKQAGYKEGLDKGLKAEHD